MTELDYFGDDKLAYTIWNNKYRYKNESFEEWLDRVSNNDTYIKELIKSKKFIFGGRTLSNRGVKDGSYSNCYSIGFVKDDLKSILETNTQLALTYKAQGGQGASLSMLRPKGTLIKEFYTSDGIVPFMKMFNQTTECIMQGGSRKGALLLSLDIWHKEAESFITIKSNDKEINKANLSLEIDDDFMSTVEECYKTNTNIIKHITKEYSGHIVEYDVDVLKLYKLLCYNALKHSEPGIIYTNRFRNYNMMQYVTDYQIETCNPCQPAWATVLTPNGIRTFGEIEVGDTIWSAEGWTKIIRKQSSGIKEVLEYKTTAGSFYGTDTHRVVSHSTKVEAKDADDIDILAGEIVPERRITLDVQDIMDGLVIGDGSVHKASNNLVFLYIGNNDIDYFTSPIASLIGKHRPALKESAYEVSTTIKAEELPMTYLREVPERFFKGTSSIVCGFLRGLYSANGSVVNNRVTFKTASPKLRDQVQIMLSSIGIRSYYTTNTSKEAEFYNGVYTCKESYDINISSDRDVFYAKIGFLQEYKMEKLNNTLSNNLNKSIKTHSIISTNLMSIEEVFNITVDNNSHTYWTGGLNVSNCGEQPLPKHGACNLSSINLSEYILNPYTKEAKFDYVSLVHDITHIVKAMDDVLTENLDRHPLAEQKMMAENYRNIGIGIMGLADAFVKLGYTYGDKQSIEFSSDIAIILFRESVIASAALGSIRGNYPKYNSLVWESDIMKKAFTEDELNVFKRHNHLRNCSLLSIAPTGSIGTMFNVSTGVEPFFLLSYTRKTETLEGKDTYYNVDVKSVNEYKTIMGSDSLPEYFVSSSDIYWKDRIAVQGALQDYIDTAISSTINLPRETTQEDIEQIYLEGWRKGLKGLTVYVDGSRDPILSKEKPKSIEGRQAPKRPKNLEADTYLIKAKGEQFIILVGMLEGKPYEIFAFRPRNPITFKPHKGIITKESKMHYSFTSDVFCISNLELANENVEENAATLYSSMLLRHGVDIKYIIKTAKKVNDNITSFSSALCRVLTKYIPNEEIKGEVCPECGSSLAREEGCLHCTNCEYSRCS